jgi:osmotically-inducible protein OsmY
VKLFASFALFALLTACTGSQQKAAFDNTVVASTIKARLIGINADATTSVRVTAAHGAVTLSGQARDLAERAKYEAAARAVDGVASVRDNLAVNPHLRGLREGADDATLTARVSAAIAGQAGINIFNLRVSSRAGVVSIDGRVPSSSIERTVVETARGTPGVKRVVVNLRIGK